jgi:FkbM family methyltransferase
MKHEPKRPIAFVLASTHHGSLIVNRHDYRLVDDSGYGVGYQLLNTSTFDAEEIRIVMQLLETRKANYGPGVVALDCGANIGVHTVQWAKLMHHWGSVVAFEAQERIFYALAGNIALNNCFNAKAVWAAVGAETGEIGVPMPNYLTPASFGSLEIRKTANTEFIGQPIDYEQLHTTPLTNIDALELDRVDLIKIDIEGMEVEALRGAMDTLAKSTPQLIIEKIKSNEQEIEALLKPLGYRLFPLGINLLAVHRSDPVCEHLANNLAENQEK